MIYYILTRNESVALIVQLFRLLFHAESMKKARNRHIPSNETAERALRKAYAVRRNDFVAEQ